jgi:hypothetical protein
LGTKKKSGPPGKRTKSLPPEIRVGYTPAGRDTMAAIAAELVGSVDVSDSEPLDSPDAGPEIFVSEGAAGRETLAAIAEEARPGRGRAKLSTLPYADRISNAPGARTPSALPKKKSSAPPKSSTPPRSPAARSSAPPKPSAPPKSVRPLITADIFEMVTFVLRGLDLATFSTEAIRRAFIEENLLHRLPVESMADVDRVDMTPWTVQGTFVLRVWCRVVKPSVKN